MTRAIVTAFSAAASAAFLLLPAPGRAHSWYPPLCCSDRDCYPLPDGYVEEGAGGFLLKATGEFIPRSEARDGRDEDFHICRNPDGLRLCFFIPARGS